MDFKMLLSTGQGGYLMISNIIWFIFTMLMAKMCKSVNTCKILGVNDNFARNYAASIGSKTTLTWNILLKFYTS